MLVCADCTLNPPPGGVFSLASPSTFVLQTVPAAALKTSNGFSRRWKCSQHSQDLERLIPGTAVIAAWVRMRGTACRRLPCSVKPSVNLREQHGFHSLAGSSLALFGCTCSLLSHSASHSVNSTYCTLPLACLGGTAHRFTMSHFWGFTPETVNLAGFYRLLGKPPTTKLK